MGAGLKWFAYALSLGQRVTDTGARHRSGDRFEKLKTEYLGADPGGDVRNDVRYPAALGKTGDVSAGAILDFPRRRR